MSAVATYSQLEQTLACIPLCHPSWGWDAVLGSWCRVALQMWIKAHVD